MYDIGYLNQMVLTNPAQLVNEYDQLYMGRIHEAADLICDNFKRSPLVMLSGPSGSGKSTTAVKLDAELESRGIITQTIELDDFYLSRPCPGIPKLPDGSVDMESPLCLDLLLIRKTIDDLEDGKEVIIPHFDFKTQRRDESKSRVLKLNKNEIAIFEGIHALNSLLTNENSKAFLLYVEPSTPAGINGEVIIDGSWMRLARRTVRDNKYRGYVPTETVERWISVMNGERRFIAPNKHRANYVLDSSLGYEPCVMKAIAYPLLKQAFETLPNHADIGILKAFEQFDVLDEKYVPETSLLREFIGGGIYGK